MISIAIFASGSGSNAVQIIKHFEGHLNVKIALVLSNKKEALVLEKTKQLKVPNYYCNNSDFKKESHLISLLEKYGIEGIILAGFLQKIPLFLVKKFDGRIINIHPSLLPKFGGKGMYGIHVHKAVLAAQEKETGITIHYVNEEYDKGEIIFQASCDVYEDDTPDAVQQRVQKLEHLNFPIVIEKELSKWESNQH